MAIDLQEILAAEERAQSSGGGSFTNRYPYPVMVPNSDLDVGEYIGRIPPSHETKNPRGFMNVNRHHLQSSKNPKESYMGSEVLHPSSFLDPNASDVYWGLDSMIKEFSEKEIQGGEKVVDKIPAMSAIYNSMQMKRNYWFPLLLSATERTIPTKNPKYPKRKWAPNGDPIPSVDVIMEVAANNKSGTPNLFAEQLFALLKANPDINDPVNGYNIVIQKNEKFCNVYLGEQAPLTKAQLDLFAGDRYPDLYDKARRIYRYSADNIIDAIKKTWYFSSLKKLELEIPEHEVDLGFEVVSSKKSGGDKKVGKAATTPTSNDIELDDVPF